MTAISEWRFWLFTIMLTGVGVAIGLGKYYIGRKGIKEIEKHFPRIDNKIIVRAINWLRKMPSIVLVLTAIPIIDTVLSVAAGMGDVKKSKYLIWSFTGKLIRNGLFIGLAWSLIRK